MNEHDLERLVSGDWTLPERQARFEQLDDAEQARLQELEQSNREILALYPPAEMAERIRARSERDLRTRRLMAAAGPVLLAAVLVLACLPVLTGSPGEDPIRIKGGEPYLLLYRSEPDGISRLAPGAAARPGDRIQLQLVTPGPDRFGVVASIDGRGAVTLHHPRRGDAVPLEPDGFATVPSSFLLDDSPGFETFYFVTADHPFDSAEVVTAVGALGTSTGDLELPDPTWTQTSISIRKEIP